MRGYQDTFTIRLKTISPVYVGSGREIDKKEYLYVSRTEIGVLDFERFFMFIQSRRLGKEFESFLITDTKGKLKDWLDRFRIEIKDIKPYLKYILPCGDTSLNRGTKVQIMEFSRDPYGMPFIPGSSLKGLLRTMFLYENVLSEESKFEKDKNSVRRAITESKQRMGNRGDRRMLQRESRNLEVSVFNTLDRDKERISDARNDILSGLVVGDSKPLSNDFLILAQKVDRAVDGTEKKMNILRESLKPDTVVEFPITIDKDISAYTREDIFEAVHRFVDCYNDSFVSKFSGMDILPENTVILGGGSGFVPKTINYALFGDKEGTRINMDIFERTGVPAVHKHSDDVRKGVSPHIIKCTYHEGKLYQMGLCQFAICDI